MCSSDGLRSAVLILVALSSVGIAIASLRPIGPNPMLAVVDIQLRVVVPIILAALSSVERLAVDCSSDGSRPVRLPLAAPSSAGKLNAFRRPFGNPVWAVVDIQLRPVIPVPAAAV